MSRQPLLLHLNPTAYRNLFLALLEIGGVYVLPTFFGRKLQRADCYAPGSGYGTPHFRMRHYSKTANEQLNSECQHICNTSTKFNVKVAGDFAPPMR